MATFASGTGGRIREGAGSTVIAGISEWKISKQLAEVPTPHFELAADANSVVWNAFLYGLADATVDLNGIFDVSGNSETTFYIGKTVVLDLLLTRTPFGLLDLSGFVKSVSYGTNVNNQPASFTAQIRLSGTVAAAA